MSEFNSGVSLKKQINLYLDNELPVEYQENFDKNITDDPRGAILLAREKHFRDYVKTNVKRPTVSPEFVQNLKSIIHS